MTARTARTTARNRAVGAEASDYANDRADYALPVGGVGAVARSRGRVGADLRRDHSRRGRPGHGRVPETYRRRQAQANMTSRSELHLQSEPPYELEIGP